MKDESSEAAALLISTVSTPDKAAAFKVKSILPFVSTSVSHVPTLAKVTAEAPLSVIELIWSKLSKPRPFNPT